MLNWSSEQEEEFELALKLSRNNSNFASPQSLFERSTPYLFLNRNLDSNFVIANFVREAALAPALQTPLGLIHQTLYSLSATMADQLYQMAVLPILCEKRESSSHLDSCYPEKNIPELIATSSDEIIKALNHPDITEILEAWRTIEFRRSRLLMASNVCYTGVAMFYALADRQDTQSRYVTVAEMLYPDNDLVELVSESLVATASTLAQQPDETKLGICLAQQIANQCGNASFVDLAATIANHVAYERFDIVDCTDLEFENFVTSIAISADHRFACLAQNVDVLRGTLERQDQGSGALIQLRSLVPWLESMHLDAERSFSRWINNSMVCSNLVRRALGDQLVELPPVTTTDNWCDQIIPIRESPLPILCETGEILGATEQEETWIKLDFIRVERLKLVNQIFSRLAH